MPLKSVIFQALSLVFAGIKTTGNKPDLCLQNQTGKGAGYFVYTGGQALIGAIQSYFQKVHITPNENRCGFYDGFFDTEGNADRRQVRIERAQQRLVMGMYNMGSQILGNLARVFYQVEAEPCEFAFEADYRCAVGVVVCYRADH